MHVCACMHVCVYACLSVRPSDKTTRTCTPVSECDSVFPHTKPSLHALPPGHTRSPHTHAHIIHARRILAHTIIRARRTLVVACSCTPPCALVALMHAAMRTRRSHAHSSLSYTPPCARVALMHAAMHTRSSHAIRHAHSSLSCTPPCTLIALMHTAMHTRRSHARRHAH